MTTLATSVAAPRVGEKTSVRAVAALAFAIGAMITFVSGFASSETVHNAAHDWRHSMNFPCH